MEATGIVPGIEEFTSLVDHREIRKEVILVIHILILYRLMEPFNSPILFRTVGIRKVVRNACLFQLLVKIQEILASIVCVDCHDGEWKIPSHPLNEISCGCGGYGRVTPHIAISRFTVYCREKIKLLSQDIEVLGIYLDEGSWVFLLQFPGCFDSGDEVMTVFSYPLPVLDVLEFRIPVNDFLNGRLTDKNTLSFQFFLYLVFTLFEVFFPDGVDALDDPRRSRHGTKTVWSPCAFVVFQRCEVFRIESLFPPVENAFGDPEVMTGSFGILFMMHIPINPP